VVTDYIGYRHNLLESCGTTNEESNWSQISSALTTWDVSATRPMIVWPIILFNVSVHFLIVLNKNKKLSRGIEPGTL
jgi:hypothetical protein